MEKQCIKCLQVKPLDEFYRHPQMADGRLGKCKECCKKDSKSRYDDPIIRKRIVRYDKERSETTERRESVVERQRITRQRNPEKYKARTAVNNAVRDGRLIKLPCEICGNPRSQGHHADYSKPLEVTWLCFKHHRENEHNQKTEP